MPSTNDLSKDKRFGTNPTPGDAEVIVPAEEPASAPAPKRSAGKTALIMLALCLAVFLAALDSVVITVALPTIARELGASDAGYAWIGSAYLLTVAALIPFWGKVSDIFGRKPTLIIANAIFMIGSLIAALSRNLTMLIAGRAVQGLGGGGLITLVNICIGDLFSPRERGMYLGIIGGIWAFASSIGPVLGGAFTQRVSWRWCFWSKNLLSTHGTVGKLLLTIYPSICSQPYVTPFQISELVSLLLTERNSTLLRSLTDHIDAVPEYPHPKDATSQGPQGNRLVRVRHDDGSYSDVAVGA